jgi:hypothetical protein
MDRFAVRLQVPERPVSRAAQAAHDREMDALRQRLTTSEQLEATVPAPLGCRIIIEERVSPLRVYNRELRNPSWAPLMEESILAVVSTTLLAKHPGVAVDVECRTSLCRLTFAVPDDLAERLGREHPAYTPALAIVGELMKTIGPPGRTLREVPMDDGRVSIVFALDGSGMRPKDYAAWQQRVTELTRANMAGAPSRTRPQRREPKPVEGHRETALPPLAPIPEVWPGCVTLDVFMDRHLDRIPADFFDRTPLRTRENADGFVRENLPAVRDTVRALQSRLRPACEEARRLFASRVSGGLVVTALVQWHLVATGREIWLRDGAFFGVVPPADAPVAQIAEECLAGVMEGSHRVALPASPGGGRSLDYDGPILVPFRMP